MKVIDRKESVEKCKCETGEIIFEVTEAFEGGFNAMALGHSIFTQGENWSDLKKMTRDAVLCHFVESELPSVILLHLVFQETIAV